MFVAHQDIEQITQMIFQSMFELDVVPSESSALVTKGFLSEIPIHGNWNGSVRVYCNGELARKVAERMFLIDEVELSPQDVTDAVGELTNMIGGNVKSLFGHECSLGFPSVQSEDLLNLGGEACLS